MVSQAATTPRITYNWTGTDIRCPVVSRSRNKRKLDCRTKPPREHLLVARLKTIPTLLYPGYLPSFSVSTPVHSPALGESGLLSQHNEHRMKSCCSRCLTLYLVFTPSALCWWAINNNNNTNCYKAHNVNIKS